MDVVRRPHGPWEKHLQSSRPGRRAGQAAGARDGGAEEEVGRMFVFLFPGTSEGGRMSVLGQSDRGRICVSLVDLQKVKINKGETFPWPWTVQL